MSDNYQRPNYRWIGRAAMVHPNMDLGAQFNLYECSMCGSLLREYPGKTEQHSDLHTDIQELMSSVLQLQTNIHRHSHKFPDHEHTYSGPVTFMEQV